MDIAWYVFFGVTIGLLIRVALTLRKKKKKNEKEKGKAEVYENDELFKKFVTQNIDGFENKDSEFLEFYESTLSGFNIEKSKLDVACENVPFAKERFVKSCRELAKIGKTNVCLIENEKLDWTQRSNEKITNDIIQVLPVLANFYKEHNYLYKYVFNDLLFYGVTIGANECTFGCFFGDEEDENKTKIREHTLDVINMWFDSEIDIMIRIFLDLDKSIDIRNSTNSQVIHYLNIAEKMKEESLLERFIDIWIMQMKKIGMKYSTAAKELMEFFDETENEIKVDLPWFSVASLLLPSCNLVLKEKTEEECLRVLDLYTSGKMTGVYSDFYEKMAFKKG